MAELTIDGDVFNVEVEGSATKPVLILANALGTVLTMWEPQMAVFRKHFRVVRFDARGHGGSCKTGAPYSIGRLGRDVLAIMDALEVERAHFVGMSMGGAVGQWCLANAPLRFDRCVLANTAPRLGSPASWNQRIADVLSGDMKTNADNAIDRWFGDAFRQANPDTIEAIRKNLLAASPGGYAACCAALRDMDLHQSIHTIEHPVLVVTGTDDPVTSDADIAALVSGLRNARHITLPARHLSNIEAAEAFSEAVVKHLTSRTPMRAAGSGRAPLRATKRTTSSARRVGSRATARQPAIKSKPAAKATRSTKAVRPTAKPNSKKTAAAPKAAAARRGRTAAAAAPRAQARKSVRSATAAPRKGTASKVDARTSAGRQTVAPSKAKAGSASRSRIAQKPIGNSAKTTSPKNVKRAASKAAPTRRSTPIASARGSKAVASKKPVASGKPVRKPVAKSAAAKLPVARRKSPAPRRPKGRGKP